MAIAKKKSAAAAASKAAPAPPAPNKPAAVSPAAAQRSKWDEAVRLFSARRFAEAREKFKEVTAGPDTQIADKARSYIQVCERKTGHNEPPLETAEDHFNYGVERMNARDLANARAHLLRAQGLDPNGDHILYALALCYGLAGDDPAACENLKRAISLEPRNRILARQDAEFAALAAQLPALRSLIGSAPHEQAQDQD